MHAVSLSLCLSLSPSLSVSLAAVNSLVEVGDGLGGAFSAGELAVPLSQQ